MRNPGKIVKVISGVHQDKQGFAYNRDQFPSIIKAGKVCVWIPETIQAALFPDMEEGKWKQVLFTPDKLKIIGFID